MKKVSAVEWFITNIAENGLFNVSTSDAIKNLNNSMKIEKLEEQAKEMEKEQHSDTWDDSRIENKGDNYIGKEKSFEQYYNETFKNK